MAGSVRRHNDGWIADVTVGGVRRTRKAKTKAEALALKRELLNQLVARPVGPGNGITMQEARALSMRIRWKGLAYERTAGIYSQQAVDHFGPYTQLGSITAAMVDEWRQKLLAEGNRPGTVNMKCGTIKSMMKDAVLRGRLDRVQDLPQQLKVLNTRDRVFSDEEVAGFCRYFTSSGNPTAADLLVFLLDTGARSGETLRLKGKDVDTKRWRVTFWHTKNKQPRSVRLTHRAIDAIKPYLPAVPDHRIWPLKYGAFRWQFDRAKEALGLADDKALTLHATRHTCASKLAVSNISQGRLMAFGGWKDLKAVQRYMHLQTDSQEDCIAALEA